MLFPIHRNLGFVVHPDRASRPTLSPNEICQVTCKPATHETPTKIQAKCRRAHAPFGDQSEPSVMTDREKITVSASLPDNLALPRSFALNKSTLDASTQKPTP